MSSITRESSVAGDNCNEDEPAGEAARKKPSAHKKETGEVVSLISGSKRCPSSASGEAPSEGAQGGGHSQAKNFAGRKSSPSSTASELASRGNSLRQRAGDECKETGRDDGPPSREKAAKSAGGFKGSLLKSAAWSVQAQENNKERGLYFPPGDKKVPKWCTSSYVCDTLKEIKADVKNILKLLTKGIPVTIRLSGGNRGATKKEGAPAKVPVVKVSTSDSAPRVVRAPPGGIQIILADEERERDTLVRIQKAGAGGSHEGRRMSGTGGSTGRRPSASPAPGRRPAAGRRGGEAEKRKASSAERSPPAPPAKRPRGKRPPTEGGKPPAPKGQNETPRDAVKRKGAPEERKSMDDPKGPPAKRRRPAVGQARAERVTAKTATAAKKSTPRGRLTKPPLQKAGGKPSTRGGPKRGRNRDDKTVGGNGGTRTRDGSGARTGAAQETTKEASSESVPEITEMQALRHAKTNPNPPRKRREVVSPRRSFHPKNYRKQIERYKKGKRKRKEPVGIEWKSPDWGKLQKEQGGTSESSEESSASWIEEIIMPQSRSKPPPASQETKSTVSMKKAKKSTASKNKRGESKSGKSGAGAESKSKRRESAGGKESKAARIPHNGDMKKDLEKGAGSVQEKLKVKPKVKRSIKKQDAVETKDQKVLDNLRSCLPASQDLNPFTQGKSTIVQIKTKKFTEEELDVASAWFWNMCCVS